MLTLTVEGNNTEDIIGRLDIIASMIRAGYLAGENWDLSDEEEEDDTGEEDQRS